MKTHAVFIRENTTALVRSWRRIRKVGRGGQPTSSASKRDRGRRLTYESGPESYPHSTHMTRVRSEGGNSDSAGRAVAYVRFVQIPYLIVRIARRVSQTQDRGRVSD